MDTDNIIPVLSMTRPPVYSTERNNIALAKPKPDITQLFNILFYEPLNTFSLFLSQREVNPSRTTNRTEQPIHNDIKLVLCLMSIRCICDVDAI